MTHRTTVTRRSFLTSTGAAGLALALGPPVVGHAQPKELLVGSIHPLTGPLAPDGHSVERLSGSLLPTGSMPTT